MKKIAIIGAGLAGLTCAYRLKNVADIVMFEKSQGVGGRMATHQAPPFVFDHGAQFFKAKTIQFQQFLAPFIAQGCVQPWHARFVELDAAGCISQRRQWGDLPPHYVGVPGMTAFAKQLTEGLTVKCGVRVDRLEKTSRQSWLLYDENTKLLGNFDWVVCALPAPQARILLSPEVSFYQRLADVYMKGCYSLLLGFEAVPFTLDFDAALVKHQDISWIAVNNTKQERSSLFSMVVHTANQWAEKHIEDDPLWVEEYMCHHVSTLIGHDVKMADYQTLHRWRYASIEQQDGESFYSDQHSHISVCGDWCIEGRVEAAFLSGYSMADFLTQTVL